MKHGLLLCSTFIPAEEIEIRIQTDTCLYIHGDFTVSLKMRWPKQMANLTNWNYKQRGESQVALGRDL